MTSSPPQNEKRSKHPNNSPNTNMNAQITESSAENHVHRRSVGSKTTKNVIEIAPCESERPP